MQKMHGPITDHGAILRWAEAHDARPAAVRPRTFDSEPAVLKFVFGPASEAEPELNVISWEEFFVMFDLLGLALVYDGSDNSNYELLQVEQRSAYRFEGKPF